MEDALAGDLSAFGGVLICNSNIFETAEEINKIFCKIVISPSYNKDVEIFEKQENRIILAKEREVSSKQFLPF